MIRDIEGGCRLPFARFAPATAPAPPASAPREADAPTFRSVLLGLRESEARADAWVGRALEHGVADPQELLRLQVVVQRFQLQLELASKVVDQVSQAVRTLVRPGG